MSAVFLVQGQSPRTSVFSTSSVGDASLRAIAMLGAHQAHVTVEGKTERSATFAVRHFRWSPERVEDSGWRCWVDGVYIGVRARFDLDELVTA